jgi:hypothetical protein
VDGAPRAGWKWNGVAVLDPPAVTLRGPRRELAHVDRLRLAPVRIEGRADTVKAVVGVDSLPAWSSIEPSTVRAAIVLERPSAETPRRSGP